MAKMKLHVLLELQVSIRCTFCDTNCRVVVVRERSREEAKMHSLSQAGRAYIYPVLMVVPLFECKKKGIWH